jgi:LAS superfamily LD-carboxypeptidase LdcB
MEKGGHKHDKRVFAIVFLLAIFGFSGAGFLYYRIARGIVQNTSDLENEIIRLQDQKMALIESLKNEQNKNQTFEMQIGQIVGTVGKLDQLSKTDKELLQKYSKVYFLNENYIPEKLTDIPPDYIWEKGKEIKMHAKAYPYLQDMITSAGKDGVNLKMISGYRSFGEQSALKGSYLITYGSGANKFSADQGFSEHQLGTALDLTTSGLGANFTEFEKSEGYKWLTQNAYKYGFILSYPKGNSYYQSEPWHWRFVGKALAKYLHEEGKYFYDLDQRKIDSYLITIFD